MIRLFPWLKHGIAVLKKDLRVEFRTRYAYSALVMFAVTTLVTVSFSVGGFLVGDDAINITAALLWIILFFSAMAGLSRTFVQEEESGTVIALKMAAEPEPVLLGKYLFNVFLLLSLTVLILPLYLVMLNISVPLPLGLLATVFLGSVGLAGASTILAAIVSKAGAKGSLMTVLAFPILLPLLFSAINATRVALGGDAPAAIVPDLWMLFFYNGVAIVASLLLFEYVWNE
ncbi:heme exporter protein CcmB [Dethiobacter alkaliphilus]|uniref:Cytochrome c-type biogenesis protein CcmB n=1 Tax=Dethiobacter alkaliphilus AHT 1 TaxID=555088 RepID=C0GG65_DETAL|nr:heme exporter protein CcmB [Dethiobacter alkaliphilus]EEG77754.1 cytochrome c-type biogenesis protein CcmB [Dethiobacter alkaliphilus AHT 1]MCW3491131.1 heme exporter protein CcmB [Dethiobacter alkaliphilus]